MMSHLVSSSRANNKSLAVSMAIVAGFLLVLPSCRIPGLDQAEPPALVETREVDKTSSWRFIASDKEGAWYIENADPRGRGLWLSQLSSAVIVATSSLDLVIEYHRAVLSKDKMLLTVEKRPTSK